MIKEVLDGNDAGFSTAEAVVQYFEAREIDRDQICGRDLEALYKALNPTNNRPVILDTKLAACPPPNDNRQDTCWGVIVETRKHPALEIVVNNFASMLNVDIQLFHGTKNEDYIRSSSISSLIEKGRVQLSPLKLENLAPRQYNELLLSREFWHAVSGRRKILVFQTDAILCGDSDFVLDDFMEFDYIGSKWPRMRPVGIVADGGNGGLSLRDWNRTIECLDRFPAEKWLGGEDAFFAFHIDVIGGRVAKGEECAQFSTQYEFLCNSFGAHKVTDLNKSSLLSFLNYCPDAKFMAQQAWTEKWQRTAKRILRRIRRAASSD